MFITVKVLKKDWKNLVKDFKRAKESKLDKIFNRQCHLPYYKAPRKFGKTDRSQRFSSKQLAKIYEIKTNILSRYYTIVINIDDASTAANVIKRNIQFEDARVVFEIYYNVRFNYFNIESFALVDKDNPTAKSTIIIKTTF